MRANATTRYAAANAPSAASVNHTSPAERVRRTKIVIADRGTRACSLARAPSLAGPRLDCETPRRQNQALGIPVSDLLFLLVTDGSCREQGGKRQRLIERRVRAEQNLVCANRTHHLSDDTRADR